MTDKEIARRLKIVPRYFVETFLWIVDKERRKVRFKFNPSQIKYYEARTSNDLILKARKEGFSALIEALWLHACIFNDNENAVTMSHTWDDTVIHLDRVKYFLDTMGGDMAKVYVPLDKENQRELFFPHSNSRYWIGTAGSTAFGRGRDITRLHLSEVAHYQDQHVITGVMEACVPGAPKVMETTANGVGEFFEAIWSESKKDPSSPWKRHFFSWFDDPTHRSARLSTDAPISQDEMNFAYKYKLKEDQVLWYRHKKHEMVDKSLMPQEYPSDDREAFLVSGSCIFDKDGLDIQEKKIEKPEWTGLLRDTGHTPEFVLDDSGPLRVYRQPVDNKRYLIFGDVAKGGIKGDRSVGAVFDRHTKALSALWYGRCDPTEFGKILFGLGLYYNTAKIAVEVWPGPGIATIAKLVDLNYRNLMRRFAWNGETREQTTEYGWVTDERSRYDMLATLQDAIKFKWAVLRAREILDECYNFVRKDSGKAEARSGFHDDCVIAAAGALHCMKFDPVAEMSGEEETNERAGIVIQNMVRQREKATHGPRWKKRYMNVAA